MSSHSTGLHQSVKATALAILLTLVASACHNSGTTVEAAYYSKQIEVGGREKLLRAGIALKNTIEANCGLVGHERSIYSDSFGENEFFFIFDSHTYDGKKKQGAIVYSSVGKRIQVKVSLFRSGFHNEEDLLACKDAIERSVT